MTRRLALLLTLALAIWPLRAAAAGPGYVPLVRAAGGVYIPLVDVRFYGMTWATVTYVWDGDTFDVDLDGDGLKDDRVRPIGIDTPEGGECYYYEPKRRTQELIGTMVALARDTRDRNSWDRLLRYVYLPDGTFWNARMVREGLAIAKCYTPDCTHYDELLALQDLAQAEALGGWGACGWEP